MITVTVSRRNLLTLLSKLDRAAKGETTQCRLIVTAEPWPDGPRVSLHAVEDEVKYAERDPGEILPEDDPQAAVQAKREKSNE